MQNIPEIGYRVTLQGREQEGEFLVLLVDTSRNTADLLRLKGVRRIEEGLPLNILEPAEQPSKPEIRPNSAEG